MMRIHLRRVVLLLLVATTVYLAMLQVDLREIMEAASKTDLTKEVTTKKVKYAEYEMFTEDHDVLTEEEKKWQHLFPVSNETNSRISEQLNLDIPVKEKIRILLWNGMDSVGTLSNARFKRDKCLMTNCFMTTDRKEAHTVDAILFMHYVPATFKVEAGLRNTKQIRILYLLESPYNADSLRNVGNVINWTATYRRDSVLTTPYAYFRQHSNSMVHLEKRTRNFAANRTKMVAWFVSNCHAANGRENYVKELQKYVSVDIYGACGPLKCPKRYEKKCFEYLEKDYRFYLSFENGNCRDYITEKFFLNALQHDIIPVVMGAPLEDYHRAAPPNSFIHVDEFESPQRLADRLLEVAGNETLYNAYFEWRQRVGNGGGSFVNTKFWCRLCGMLNVAARRQRPVWYEDLGQWWGGPGVCVDADTDGWASWRAKGGDNHSDLNNHLPALTYGHRKH